MNSSIPSSEYLPGTITTTTNNNNNKDALLVKIIEQVVNIGRVLTCPCCQSFFTNSQLLNCGHTICFDCLLNIKEGLDVRSMDSSTPSCPECRVAIISENAHPIVDKVTLAFKKLQAEAFEVNNHANNKKVIFTNTQVASVSEFLNAFNTVSSSSSQTALSTSIVVSSSNNMDEDN